MKHGPSTNAPSSIRAPGEAQTVAGAAANGATAESPAASSTKRKTRVPKEYAEHFNERSDEEKAKGGIGLAICGGSSVVAIDSPQHWWSSVNLSTDRIIPHFQNLADAMHKHGAKIMIQITHMGRRYRWDGFNWPTLM